MQLVFGFLFIIIQFSLFSQKEFQIISSSKGKITDVFIGKISLCLAYDFIEKLHKNRTSEDVINIYIQNNGWRSYEKDECFEKLKIDFQCTDIAYKEDYLNIKNCIFFENGPDDYFFSEFNKTVRPIDVDMELNVFQKTVHCNKFFSKDIDLEDKFFKVISDSISKKFNGVFYNVNVNDNRTMANTFFVQDMFLASKKDNNIVLLFNKKNKELLNSNHILDTISNLEHISKKEIPIDIHGGNILFLNSDTAFIGKDDIEGFAVEEIEKHLNLKKLFVVGTKTKIISASRPNATVGKSYQILYHLDLFFNVINTNPPIILLGKFISENRLSKQEIDWNLQLDTIAQILLKDLKELKIFRTPLQHDTLYKYTFSPNNCQIEIVDDQVYAYVPYYNSTTPYYSQYLDSVFKLVDIQYDYIYYAKDDNEKIGFDRFVIKKQASLHCLTKVLKRD